MSSSSACAFCAEIARAATPNLVHDELGAAVGDRYLLTETEDFVVMPSIGALVPGYSLILPRSHVRSMAHLTSHLLRQLHDVVDDLSRRLAEEFAGRIVFYEHGPVTSAIQAGSCADHAHLHVVPVPVDVDLAPGFLEDYPARVISGFEELRGQVERGQPYLLLGEFGRGAVLSDAADVVSQYFRRKLAAQLGRADEWDWVMYPQAAHVQATINRFPRRLAS